MREKSASYVLKYAYRLGINQTVDMDFSLGEKIDERPVKGE
jgi:hypothetical protein